MTNKIENIEEFNPLDHKTLIKGKELYEPEGFVVRLTTGFVFLIMEMGQNCCESPGYFLSEEDLDSFVGAEYLGVDIVDEALATVEKPAIYEGGVMFVNINTNKGPLQFVAYNEHNGYYAHRALVIVDDKILYEEVL